MAPSAAPPLASGEGADGTISFLLGGRFLDETSARRGGVEDQPVLEVMYDTFNSDGHGYEVGAGRSEKHGHLDGFPVGSDLTEVYFGYRKTFRAKEVFQPYFSLGGSAMHGDADFGTGDDDDGWAAVPYARLGVQWLLAEHFRLGLEYRKGVGTFYFSGENFDANFDQFALSVGFPF